MRGKPAAHLRQLAKLYGIQTSYYDAFHHHRHASVESLLSILQALDAPVASFDDIEAAWREKQQRQWQKILEPVTVAWDGAPFAIRLQLPAVSDGSDLQCRLTLENGKVIEWRSSSAEIPVITSAEIEGTLYVAKMLPVSRPLPWGYHHLSVAAGNKTGKTMIIAAPARAYMPAAGERIWGVFIPLYALHSRQSWGSGDFGDLLNLMDWVAESGGNTVATLPLLASFTGDTPFAPGPYTPASRLLWNEFYLDMNDIPEMNNCPTVQNLMASSHFQNAMQILRGSVLVDYRQVMALKRSVLEELCQCLFSGKSGRLQELQHFAGANPVAADYASFRAAIEKQRTSWRSWPQALRDGTLREGDYEENTYRYHLYVQWLAQQQMQGLSETTSRKRMQLYLDLPLGVHPDSYDVWRERDNFAVKASAGAPPDVLFVRGQYWDFPPHHPERIRENGYKYIISYLRHHLQFARILRIDHILGLNSLYWIPQGVSTDEGAYVRYPAEELYAILCLESHRYQSVIVGEDLGTVPPEIKPAMNRHGLQHMYVLDYELYVGAKQTLRPVPVNSSAQTGTHDMPPFTAFWQGLDIETRLNVGILNKESAQKERTEREKIKADLITFLRCEGWLENENDIQSILQACLSFLSAGKNYITLVNLEDLWGETHSQNIPSTTTEYPNWRYKASHSLETLQKMAAVTNMLQTVARLRRPLQPLMK